MSFPAHDELTMRYRTLLGILRVQVTPRLPSRYVCLICTYNLDRHGCRSEGLQLGGGYGRESCSIHSIHRAQYMSPREPLAGSFSRPEWRHEDQVLRTTTRE